MWSSVCSALATRWCSPRKRRSTMSNGSMESGRRIAIIPPGVDRLRFRPGDRMPARIRLGLEHDRVVLFVGRMDRAKGVEHLLRATATIASELRSLKSAVVVVGGDDGQRDSVAHRELLRLERIVDDLRIRDLIDFRGVVPHEELPDYYAAADVCAVPSLYESFGMVAVEALACGRPVVAFRSRGLEQTVRDGVNGFLVPPSDVTAFGQSLLQMLSDPQTCARMERAAPQSVQDMSWETVADRTVALYESLCGLGQVAVGQR